MNALTGGLARLADRVDRATLRERILLFAAGMALIWMAWQGLLMDRLNARQHASRGEIDGIMQRLSSLEASESTLDAAANPKVQALQREHALRAALESVDRDLSQASQGFVEPALMVDLVRALMSRQSGLTLVSLRSLPVETVLPVVQDRPAQGPYVHPLEIVVDGSYPQIVGYLQSLERLPWRLNWRRVELETRDYPVNRVRIEIATLSMSREWLQV